MYRLLFLTIISTCLAFSSAERVRYDNYRVYKVTPVTKDQVKLLSDLEAASDSLIFLEGVNFVGKDVDVIVAPHKVSDFKLMLGQNEIQHKLIESNVQRKLDVNNELTASTRNRNTYSWNEYHTLEETYAWLDSLVDKYPDQIKSLVGGQTYEGREIRGVLLSKKSGNKAVFIEGGIHAREWISPAVVTYMLNELLTTTDPTIKALSENYDWYFFPHTNPDGYVYTHTTDRLWRKTRSRNIICYGTDPNRNWDFHWNEVGASNIECTDTYAGKKAFSEIETRTFAEFISSVKNIQLYISFHSFSQLLLFPYGHTKTHAPNHDDLYQIGKVAVDALKQRYNTKYIFGNIYETIYPASGASVDWVYGKVNVPLSYCYELRPASGGWDGFVLPADQIIPTGEETMDSVAAMIKEATRLKYY